jgi:hypothetical protein
LKIAFLLLSGLVHQLCKSQCAASALTLFPYANSETQLKSQEYRLSSRVRTELRNLTPGFPVRPSMIANRREVLRILNRKHRLIRNENWHVWPVTIPRRSITGRLVWGTVLRRWDGRRWSTRNISRRRIEWCRSILKNTKFGFGPFCECLLLAQRWGNRPAACG